MSSRATALASAAVAVALAFVLVLPGSATAAPLGFPPPAATEAVGPTQLPDCARLDQVSDPEFMDSVLLGWAPSSSRLFIDKGTYSQELVPTMLCYAGGAADAYRAFVVSSRVTGSKSNSTVIATADVTFRCWNGSSVTTVPAATVGSWAATGVNGIAVPSGSIGVNRSDCPQVVSVTIVARSGFPSPDGQASATWVWKPSFWTSDKGGWEPGTSPADFYPDGVELPIICVINNSGADLFEVMQNFLSSLAQLPACWFVPVGWDRAGRIAAEWKSGAAGELSDAFEASVPNGLVCGVVATIPMWGQPVTLNTCPVDVAGDVVKTVVGWVMVLGVCALMVRRILWTVGSKA